MIIKRKLYSLAGTRFLAGFNKKVLRKAPMAAKRSAVKTQNKVIGATAKGLNKVEGAKTAITQAAANPGGAVSKLTEETLRHPITASTNVIGKATMVVDPTGIGLVPLGTIGTAGETVLRKYSPRYARVTDRLANGFKNSRGSQYIEGGVNGIVNGLRTMY